MKENDFVTIIPEILRDQYYKSRHYIFERILAENEVRKIRYMDLQESRKQIVEEM